MEIQEAKTEEELIEAILTCQDEVAHVKRSTVVKNIRPEHYNLILPALPEHIAVNLNTLLALLNPTKVQEIRNKIQNG